ncbi:lamina-associated polypeptide 2, isoforms alpha/zeta-like [Lissotriton helveticus]
MEGRGADVRELGCEDGEVVAGSSTAPSMANIQKMIEAAVAAAFVAHVPKGPKRQKLDASAEVDPDVDSDEEVKGRFVQGADLRCVMQHVRDNLGFPDPVEGGESEDFFANYLKKDPESLPIHTSVRKVLEGEWKDVDRHAFPRFLAKRYPLQGFAEEFPAVVKVDSLLAGMASQSLVVSEDAVPSDPGDKRVEGALKRSFAASNLAVRSAAYTSYLVQSLLKDCQGISAQLMQEEDPSESLSMLEQQLRFMADLSFDSLSAAAAAAGASVAARRQLWLKSWKAEAAQKAAVMKIPFTGSKLFGEPLEALIKKTAEDKKLLAPVRSSQKGKFAGYKRAFGQAFQSKMAAQPFRGRGRGRGVPSFHKSRGQHGASSSAGPSKS